MLKDGPAVEMGAPVSLEYPAGDWDFVKTVPAHGEDYYNTVCETLCDSTITEGMCWSTFFVRAATEDPYVYFDCAPDSGYSVDNLAPHPPENLRWEEATLLAWEESADADFNYFAVYGSESEVFDPETAELIEYTIATSLDVTGTDHLYYHTTATDFAGNEGEASTIQREIVGIDEAEVLPAAFALHPCRPNPFNPSTMIRYDLPETAPVRLEIFDINGRSVRLLVDEPTQGPGQRVAEWDGRDDQGKTVQSGLYYYRIKAGVYAETMRMVLLK